MDFIPYKIKELNSLTEKIDTIQAQKNACNRIIARYEEIKTDYQKEPKAIEKAQTLKKEYQDKTIKK